MIKQAIISFNDITKLGIEKIPNEQFIYVGSLQKFFIKDNNAGLIAGKTIQEAIDTGCLIEAGKRVCNPFSAAMFYGGLGSTLTILSKTGVLVQPETIISMTFIGGIAGANNNINCLFYGGEDENSNKYNNVRRLSFTGTLLTAMTYAGSGRFYLACVGFNDLNLFYGGALAASSYWDTVNKVLLLKSDGTISDTELSVGTSRANLAGSKSNINALFYGGQAYTTVQNLYNIVTIINSSGSLVQSENSIGQARDSLSGAQIGVNSLFWGGSDSYTTGNDFHTLTLLSSTGTLVQTETTLTSTKNMNAAAANVGTNVLFYGGGRYGTNWEKNGASVITPSLVLAIPEVFVGTARHSHAGASI